MKNFQLFVLVALASCSYGQRPSFLSSNVHTCVPDGQYVSLLLLFSLQLINHQIFPTDYVLKPIFYGTIAIPMKSMTEIIFIKNAQPLHIILLIFSVSLLF